MSMNRHIQALKAALATAGVQCDSNMESVLDKATAYIASAGAAPTATPQPAPQAPEAAHAPKPKAKPKYASE